LIRPAEKDDLDFIRSGWRRSYASSDWALFVTPKNDIHTVACNSCGQRTLRSTQSRGGKVQHHAGDLYWDGHRAVIEQLLSTSNTSVSQGDDGMLDGFICRRDDLPVLHYVYVRQSAREKGVARELVADLWEKPTRFTHLSRSIVGRKLPAHWKFDPYFLMGVSP